MTDYFNGIAVIIGAVTLGLPVAVSSLIQWKTFKQGQLTNQKLDENTKLTQEGNKEVLFGQTQAIQLVKEAKGVSVANAAALQGVFKKIDTVAESKTQSIDRIAEAKLAQGIAEGHIAGVAAEQARVANATGEVPVYTPGQRT